MSDALTQHLRIYTGRFARALLSLYPASLASRPEWPFKVPQQR